MKTTTIKKTESRLLEKPLRNLPAGLPAMADRVEWLRCVLGFPLSSFAIKVGSSKASLKKVLEGKATPNMKMLMNLLQIFPIEEQWLYLGTGQPFKVDDITDHMFSRPESKTDDYVDVEVNERFREVRMEKALSQPVFASTLDITKDVVAFIETGRSGITIPVLKRFVKKYGISEQWLLWGVGNKYKIKK